MPARAHPSPFGLLQRDYKTFIVRGDTGEVIAMKIREPPGAKITDLPRLIDKHRRSGLFVDTNLLLLY